MTPIQQGERFAVFDDFLPSKLLQQLRQHADQAPHHLVDSVVDARIDGQALRSRGGIFGHDADIPSDGVGAAMAAVKSAVADNSHIYGEVGIDWTVLSFAMWQYPAGTRLGWHNDAGNGRTGEFILYLHEEWRPSWGGELVILDALTPLEMAQIPLDKRYLAVEDVVAASPGPLVAITPKPNRLVMVRAGTCHYINRVDSAAGQARRRSMTGFASRPPARTEAQQRQAQISVLMNWGSDTSSETRTTGG